MPDTNTPLDLERRVFHLQTLYEVAQALNECRESAQIFQQVLTILMGTFGVEHGLALRWQPENTWQLISQRGLETSIVENLQKYLNSTQLSLHHSSQKGQFLKFLLRQIFQQELNDTEFAWLEFVARNKILGGILLGTKISGEGYSPEDRELLDAVTSYVTSSLENLQLYEELKEAQERLQLENIALREEVQREFETGTRIIGQSQQMRKILEQIRSIAKSPSSVLIYGETGTGKELVAKAIHYLSPRKDGPFVAFNSTAIPENLVESELFGIEAGVATGVKKHIGYFEQAHGGTLFIDEIGDMPLSSQAKILRVLQEKSFRRVGGTKEIQVDVRFIAATNKNLQEEIQKGSFREDLFYRVSVLEIQLPPLRERREDIPLLVNHFVKEFQRKIGKQIKGISRSAMRVLMEYDWPGNIRELENEIERVITLVREGTIIQPEDWSNKIKKSTHNLMLPTNFESGSLREIVDNLERQLIFETLEKFHWNKSKTARTLGLSRLGLQKKINRLGIQPKVNPVK